MRNILTVTALFLLIAGNALAGSEYDKCVADENTLKARETADCKGLSYLLNPSACFAAQKALKEYAGGKCRKIGIAENVDFSVQKAIPEKKTVSVSRPNNSSINQKKTETEAPQQVLTTDQLKDENARLRAEVIRLKAENELLKKTGR
jgi:hypothetical protein